MKYRFLSLVCGAAAALFASCAQPEAPRGGEPDRSPPYVRETLPEAMAVVPAWDGPVVLRFNERISQRGIEQAVTVSPETGEVEVEKGRSELRISMKGGWREGQIYRIVVHPVIQDLFGNTVEEPIDLIFSTGPPIPNTALAGLLTDRITADAVQEARVEAIRRADSVTYVAVTDTAGFYALRHIPAGAYDLRAYVDRNRNREPDFNEPLDTARAVLSVTDTTVISFGLLAGDTTASNLLRAEASDSLHVRLHFDDYMDPEATSLDDAAVELLQLPDSTPVAVAEVLWPHEFEQRMAERRAVQDSLAALQRADSVAVVPEADSLGTGVAASGDRSTELGSRETPSARVDAEASDAVDVPEGSKASEEETAPADTARPLPVREVVVVSADPLPPETDLVLKVTGIRNIHALPGGGGTVELRTPAAPADTVPTQAVPADTVPTQAVPVDTMSTGAEAAATAPPGRPPADSMSSDTASAGAMPGNESPGDPHPRGAVPADVPVGSKPRYSVPIP